MHVYIIFSNIFYCCYALLILSKILNISQIVLYILYTYIFIKYKRLRYGVEYINFKRDCCRPSNGAIFLSVSVQT